MKELLVKYYDILVGFIKGSLVFNRLLKNAGKLLSGEVAASGISLITMAFAARALGPEQFGILALIQAYVVIVDKTINFQSWQALIKYGSDALTDRDDNSLKGLIKFGFFLDISTSILGAIVAVLGAKIFGVYMDWESETVNLAKIGRAHV